MGRGLSAPIACLLIGLTAFLSYRFLTLQHSSNHCCSISHLPPRCASGRGIGPDARQELAEAEKEEKKVRSRPGDPGAEEDTLCNQRTTWELVALATAV